MRVISAVFCPSCGSPQITYHIKASITKYNLQTREPVVSYSGPLFHMCLRCNETFPFSHDGYIAVADDGTAYAIVQNRILLPTAYNVYKLSHTNTGENTATFCNPEHIAELKVNDLVTHLVDLLRSDDEQVAASAFSALLALAIDLDTA